MKLCEQYENMISAFIDGVLSEEDRGILMEHMADCPDCQAYFDQQIAIHDALMDDAEHNMIKAPEGFTADVMARVRFTPQEKKPFRKAAVHWKQWAALAACCAIAAAGLWTARAPKDLAAENMQRAAVTEDRSDTTAAVSEEDRDIPETTDETVEETVSVKREADTALAGGAALSAAPPPAEIEQDTGALSADDAAPERYADIQDADMEPGDGLLDNGTSMQSVAAMPAPAADVPEEESGAADSYTMQSATGAYRCIMTASGPVVRAWIEEQGLPWTEGGFYELSAEEYEQLREALSEAGESCTEAISDAENSEGFLLITKESAETD